MKSSFVSLTNGFYRLLCRIQGVLMAVRLNAAQYVSVIVGLAVMVLELVTGIGDELFNMSSLILLLGFVAVLAPALNELFELHRNNVSYTINSSDTYHDEVLDRVGMSADYEKAGYHKRSYVDCGTEERYVDSPRVNAYLFQGSVHPDQAIAMQRKRSAFRISEDVRPLVSGIIQRMLKKSKGRRLFNGSLVRLSSDIFPDTTQVEVQKAKYFDGQCTHEIVFKRASHSDSAEKNFLGETLLMDENDKMIELWSSHCANFIGSSTLAVTADNSLLIGIQGGQSMANANRMAPSGSGSVAYNDLSHCPASAGKKPTLQDIVIFAAERELREECALPGSAKLASYVIGYTRLLERGGKPDFFSITFVDMTAQQVLDNFEAYRHLSEVALGCKPLVVKVVPGQRVSAALQAFLDDVRAEQPDKHRVSIQLQLSADYIAAIEQTAEWETIWRNRANAS